MAEPVLAARGITKRYGGVLAADQVDFDVLGGECVGLVGKNGAGKSTLIKILAGLVRRDEGVTSVDGVEAPIASAHEAQRLGLAFLHQVLNDVPTLTVTENVWLGHSLPKRALRLVDRAKARARAAELLDEVGATADPDAVMGTLSAAQRQLVMLARAISHDARLIVMDEPTASLSDREVAHLRTVLAHLRERATSVVFVSHRLGEVLEFCDRVVVMRDGRVVGRRATAALAHDELVSLITGDGDGGSRTGARERARRQSRPGEEVLRVEGLTRGGQLHDVSFSLRRGEVLGIAGLVGSGRTELARVLFGIDRPTAGRILLDGREVHLRSPRAALRQGITLLPEDRLRYGVVGRFDVRSNLTLPTLARFRSLAWLPMPSPRRETRAAEEVVRRLSVATAGVTQPVASLSGGNQQKIVLGKWLLHDAGILVFDEPTEGVDVGAKEEIYREVAQLAEAGKSVLFISSEFEELLAVADRVLVLREGAVSGILAGDQLTERRMLALCYEEAGR